MGLGWTSLTTSTKRTPSSTSSGQTYKPHDYQKRAIRLLVKQVVAGLFMDPGMGKTSCVLAAISLLKKKGYVNRVLVIAPLRVAHNVWPVELQKWKDFHHLSCTVIHGNQKDELIHEDTDIHVINPEGLFMFVDKLVKEVVNKRTGKVREVTEYRLKREFRRCFPYDMLVVDESTRFKRSTCDRFKRLKEMLKHFKRRVILTGTPAPNGLEDLFGQIYILDQGRALGAYITHYRNRWFSPAGYGGYQWQLNPGAEREIYAAIKPYVLRLEDKDYLKLPPLITTTVTVTLPLAVRAMYHDMEEELIAQLEDNLVVAKNAGVATGKCRQIAGGGVYLSDKHGNSTRNVKHLHTVKVDAVVELLEELRGKPTLVLYEFEHEATRLVKAFGKTTALIKGGMTPRQTTAILERWNRGELPYLVAQVDAVAHGLNLQATGRVIIFHSLTWNLESYLQAVKRIWRQGQKHRTLLYHVVAEGTIDEVILGTVLGGKKRTQDELLAALKAKLLKTNKRKKAKKI